MNIRMEGDHFSMKLTNGISEKVYEHSIGANGLANVQKRLTLLYPGKHELKMTSEQEMFIVLLNIHLDEATINLFEEEVNYPISENKRSPEKIFKYASD
jgi:hypothetical protein